MSYQASSINEVIGRVIRNTRVSDTAYIADMHEWIPEAMELLHTQNQYSHEYEDIDIKFHKGKLPCGLVFIYAVEYCGTRLPYGNSVRDVRAGQRPAQYSEAAAFISRVDQVPVPNGNYVYFSTLTQVLQYPENTVQYYQTDLGRILTSFETGTVRIYFAKVPVDGNGLPLIPDNSNYKEALYWYCRQKMIEAGFSDPVMKWEACHAMFEKHAERAVTEIDYPSPDEMEHRINTLTTLIKPANYFDEFFRVAVAEQFKTNLV